MDGEPSGRVKCSIANWTGIAYKIPRTALDKCKDLDILKQQVLQSVERLDERRGILHIRRHLAATPLFKGIPDFKSTRVAMLRAETVEELFGIMDGIETNFEV